MFNPDVIAAVKAANFCRVVIYPARVTAIPTAILKCRHHRRKKILKQVRNVG